MQTFLYKNQEYLTIPSEEIHRINSAKSILIQLFSGKESAQTQEILLHLRELFANAHIITTTTDGEIIATEILEHSSVIAISIFEKTAIKTLHVDEQESFATGKKLAQQLLSENSKLLITFLSCTDANGEEFLNGIAQHLPAHTLVAGGLSGDNAAFKQCHIGEGTTLYDSGAVGVVLDSQELFVDNFYCFGWKAIGIEHTITKSDKNRVYTIDNLTSTDFYKKYLGESASGKFLATGIEFPLIVNRDGLMQARAVIATHDDGSLSFAGNLQEGERVYIGIGESQTMLSQKKIAEKKSINVESFFIYSCMARRRFMPQLIQKEIEPFAALAPTSGFFTYGEFFTNSKLEFFNQSLTAVSLSETAQCNINKKIETKPLTKNSTIEALMNIINVTSQELQAQKKLQKQAQEELLTKTETLELIQEISNLGSWELDLTTMEVSWSKTSYIIHNLDPSQKPPSFAEFLAMVLPEDREKFINVYEKLRDGALHSIEIRVKRNDNKILTLIESGKILLQSNRAVKIVGTTLDITDIRLKDALLLQQSKSAQMGEMVNMIAHQWRQPLNAISSAVIKLNMQSTLKMLTHEKLTETTTFIEDMTQKMSQTIDDFMNFSKPSNTKEIVNFEEIFASILKIIGPQLSHNDIILNLNIEEEIELFTYKKELEHILINLIINARDALMASQETQERRIDVTITSEGEECRIEVLDNGGGVKEDLIDRIFDPYFTTKEAKHGTGLGLYMSKKILNKYLGGEITMQNKGNGAAFTIVLSKKLDTKQEGMDE